jgi:hypothetical protein
MVQQFLSGNGNSNFSNMINNNFANDREFIFSKSPDTRRNTNIQNDKIISKLIYIYIN